MSYAEQVAAGIGYNDGFSGTYVVPRNFYMWSWRSQRAYLMAWAYGRWATFMRNLRGGKVYYEGRRVY